MKHNMVWLPGDPSAVEIGFCPSEKAWAKFMRRIKMPPEKYGYPTPAAGDGHAHCTDIVWRGRRYSIITVRADIDEDTPLKIIGLLTHECMHCWQNVLHDMSEAKPSIEFEAYFVQTLVQRTIEAYEKTRRRLTLKVTSRSKRRG